MISFIKKHPLATCLIIALLLRLLATVYSKGFMAHDDHFETVRIAYDGIHRGLLNDDNLLIWNTDAPERIGRSPLYVLFLFSLMKIQEMAGIQNLDSMMYFIRLIHALLSLLLVFYGYKYVEYATKNKNYALITGLILAGHFLMPYLGVRTLIELVSAEMMMPSIFLAYKGAKENDGKLLMAAGLLSGLAWMIRFVVCLAAVPIPFAIWYQKKSIKPALYYMAGILIMILFSGSLDQFYLGRFGQSTINILRSFFTGSPTLPQPFYMYLPLAFGVLIPPFSFYLLVTPFRKKVMPEHIILVSSVLLFFIGHSLIANKQERFLIPIFPQLIVMGMIGLYYWLKSDKISNLNRKIFKYSAIFALVINLILLPIFTFNYAHKCMVEPFVYLSHQDDVDTVLIDRTERHRFLAYGYSGFNRPEFKVLDNWAELASLGTDGQLMSSVNYFLIYSDTNPTFHADSLSRYFGPMERVFHSTPSTVDYILHFMNPKHNHTNEAWIYKKTK